MSSFFSGHFFSGYCNLQAVFMWNTLSEWMSHVAILASDQQKSGYFDLTWNSQDTKGRSCRCGVYFCILSAENQRFSRKVILTE